MTNYHNMPSRALLGILAREAANRPALCNIPGTEIARAIDDLMRFLDQSNEERWDRFVIAPTIDRSTDHQYIRMLAAKTGLSFEEAQAAAIANATATIYRNNLYQVSVIHIDQNATGSPFPLIELSIKRVDQRPIRDWRHMQRIKNELIGPEYEAIELYPAESRLVDTANQYFLWVINDPTFKWPVGFTERKVLDADDVMIGAVQRPFETTKRRLLDRSETGHWQIIELERQPDGSECVLQICECLDGRLEQTLNTFDEPWFDILDNYTKPSVSFVSMDQPS